ncbi:hypothetical protein LZ554_005012 [Drepanopeziza brunnea f. sp. 'monogermtubi']|nr:hypothetical protein LZ554_005012 [Drepanopeziza brunnea f. sp. 'monogermtubi']
MIAVSNLDTGLSELIDISQSIESFEVTNFSYMQTSWRRSDSRAGKKGKSPKTVSTDRLQSPVSSLSTFDLDPPMRRRDRSIICLKTNEPESGYFIGVNGLGLGWPLQNIDPAFRQI